jgi:hypothetical protein
LVAVAAVGVLFIANGFQSLEFAYALIFAIAILGLNLTIRILRPNRPAAGCVSRDGFAASAVGPSQLTASCVHPL